MKITNKTIDKIYDVFLRYFKTESLGLMIYNISKSLAFRNANGVYGQICREPWYGPSYDTAIYMNRFEIPAPTKYVGDQFQTLTEFSHNFNIDCYEVKKHFIRILLNNLKQNDLYMIPENIFATFGQRDVCKISSLEELMIKADLEI